jgi:hypothetical protein
MIQYENVKYVFNCSDTDELYDFEKDPNELNNLVKDKKYSEALNMMRVKLAEWMVEMGDGLLERYKRIVHMV